ncbi:translation elongation factor Ts [Patescibacteria group bacterium]
MKDIQKIKELRDDTGAGVMEAKEMLEKHDGDIKKAKEELMKKASAKAAKKADRVAEDGLVYSYIHNKGKVGSMLLMACETDFVAKTDDFKKLCKEIAMQICTDEYKDVDELLKSPYMRDESKTIQDLINETLAKVGEKIELKKFIKYTISD